MCDTKKEKYYDLLDTEIKRLNAFHHQRENKMFTLIIFQTVIFGALFKDASVFYIQNSWQWTLVLFSLFSFAWFYIHYIISWMQQNKAIAVLKAYTFQQLRLELINDTCNFQLEEESEFNESISGQNISPFPTLLLYFLPLKRFFISPINDIETYPYFMKLRVIENLKEHSKFQKFPVEQWVYPLCSLTMWLLILSRLI